MIPDEIPDERVVAYSLALLVIIISFLVPRCFGTNQPTITLRPCPNPDCIRCRKYRSAQEYAVKRLPYLIKEWQQKHQGVGHLLANTMKISRIEDGVRAGPPPLPAERLFWGLNRDGKDYGNAHDQFPSVLFIPRLPVYPIATHLHQQVCDLLSASDPAMKTSRRDIMMDEYLNSQMYDGAWNINDSGALDPKNPNQLWQVLYLMNQGKWIESNIELCEETFSFLQQIPQEMMMDGCMFGNIFFSVLYPGTKIEEHCGPTNVRHRLHFPLHVPSHNDDDHQSFQLRPSLTVSGEEVNWVEGHAFVFDDSLLHSAKYPDNNESEVRVVLVLDLWHPDLSHDESLLITDLYPSSS